MKFLWWWLNISAFYGCNGALGSLVGWGIMLQSVAGLNPMKSLDIFQFTQSLHPHYGPGVDSASKRND
jgi:hypothetical protein